MTVKLEKVPELIKAVKEFLSRDKAIISFGGPDKFEAYLLTEFDVAILQEALKEVEYDTKK